MGAAVFDLSDSAAPQKQVSSPVIEYIVSGLGRGRLCKIFREIIRQSSLVSSEHRILPHGDGDGDISSFSCHATPKV